jgi:hypothetical protein
MIHIETKGKKENIEIKMRHFRQFTLKVQISPLLKLISQANTEQHNFDIKAKNSALLKTF